MVQRDQELETALRVALDENAPGRASDDLRRKVLGGVAQTPQRRGFWRTIDWRRGSRGLFASFAGVGLTIFAVAMLVGLLAMRPEPGTGPSTGTPENTAQPAVSVSLSTEPAPSSPGPPTPHPVTALIPGASNFPILSAGSVWAPRFGTGDLVRFDPQSNQIAARITVSRAVRERGPHALAVRGDEIWINAEDDDGWALQRIDPATNTVAERIPVGVPGWALAIVGDLAWMTSFEHDRVLAVNLDSGEVEVEIKTLLNPLGIAATEDDVWVALGGRGTVARIDPASGDYSLVQTGTETTTIPLVMGDEVWVTTLYSGEVVIVSRDTNEVIDRIELQAPMGITRHDGLAWITDSYADVGDQHYDDRVIAIDIATREIVHELPLTGLDVDRGITVENGTVWAVTTDGVVRLDLDR